ncbi:MAG: TPM domain-containing protein [Bacteroidota bacterium]|nr:TPM domain-containing protein [Bacteroidota bacterium]
MRFPWQKKKEFFTAEESSQLVSAIQKAELRTSGEVRLFVESKCRFVNAVDRANEIFLKLQMDKTELRNATLIYIAMKDKQAAVFGDVGIHEKVGEDYWKDVVSKMLLQFGQEKLIDGICSSIAQLGEALVYYFPYNKDTDKNELPDEIVFGK